MPCNYVVRSVTLQPNEPFNLPPGAELIGASDINSLKSTCPLPTNLEQLACFICIIPVAGDDGGGLSQYWEGNQNRTKLIGYNLSGVYTAFGTQYNTSASGRIENDTAFKAEILNIPGVSHVDFNLAIDGSGRGSLNYILVTTVPSVSNNLELVMITSAPASFSGPTDGKGYFKFLAYSDVVASGYIDLPTCNIPDSLP